MVPDWSESWDKCENGKPEIFNPNKICIIKINSWSATKIIIKKKTLDQKKF